MPIADIANVVAQTGLPVGLIVWGIWFITARAWPWFSDPARREMDRAIERGKSDALIALARAIGEMARVIELAETCGGHDT